MRIYKTSTLTPFGSFPECTGRFFVGFFSDGRGDYDWGATKYSSLPS
jgi:hypothetical protein